MMQQKGGGSIATATSVEEQPWPQPGAQLIATRASRAGTCLYSAAA